jgi:DNA (cytosine-5)-methyltransferase 1
VTALIRRPEPVEIVDSFCGEGGVSVGWKRAADRLGIPVRIVGLDNDPARLEHYPFEGILVDDAVPWLEQHAGKFDIGLGSPTCTGYSRGTAALPDRLERYDRLIPATREALRIHGKPYVIENVADARSELVDPVMLCGRMFGLTAVDDDGTVLTLDRHRLFEIHGPAVMIPEHIPHGWKSNARDGIQVAGAYGGARRDKVEAREVRKGGYVPPNLDVLRALLDTPWMTERGCFHSIPPAYAEHLAMQILPHLG